MSSRPDSEAAIIALFACDDPRTLDFDDDVAILAEDAAGTHVVTTDMLVEDVDFRLKTFSPADVAFKALAVNLSDLAAAGAAPTGFVQALAIPPHIDRLWLEGYARGLTEAAAAFGCPLLGGDLSKTAGPLSISITAFGSTSRLLLRRTARNGDVLAVTGALGAAAAGFALLEAGVGDDSAALSAADAAALRAQRRPVPRLDVGRWLGERDGVRGAMDLSDGLAADLPRFLPRGLYGRLGPLPVHAAATEEQALRGGEDYELLIAVAPESWPALRDDASASGLTLLEIGFVTDEVQELGAGFDHFAK